MAEYQLYCFAQSGNSYRAALMLNLIGASWEPVFVDFFGGGVQRTPQFRTEINEMGEAPGPQGYDEHLECLRWLLFDNQKVNGYLGPYRFLKNFAPKPDPGGMAFLKGRIDNSLAILDKRVGMALYVLGERPTIADLSLVAYLYYPAEEFGFDIAKDYPAIGSWLGRIKALPGWAHPYDLMPGHPLPKR